MGWDGGRVESEREMETDRERVEEGIEREADGGATQIIEGSKRPTRAHSTFFSRRI